jgi:hypothetical protein
MGSSILVDLIEIGVRIFNTYVPHAHKKWEKEIWKVIEK